MQRNVHLSALRRLAAEAADNGLLDPDIAAGIAKVKGTSGQGVRTGNWLTKEQSETILRLPDVSTLKGKRDRAILSVLIGCGLRRSEAAALNVEDIQQRDGRWVIPDLVGKHNRMRTVPMPGWTKVDLDAWLNAAGITAGRIFRSMHKGGGILRQSITAQSIFLILTGYGSLMGLRFAPHDARRSFAKLAHRGRAALEQIQITLGHASIQPRSGISASARICLMRRAITWVWIWRADSVRSMKKKRQRGVRSNPAWCSLCGFPIPRNLVSPTHPLWGTVDHTIPRSRGGPDTLYNRAPVHLLCNKTKANRIIYAPERCSWALTFSQDKKFELQRWEDDGGSVVHEPACLR